MKCPDCHHEVKFQPEYCPHCSGLLIGRNKRRVELNRETNGVNFLVAGMR
jgi:hypothetical protein